MNRSLAFQDRKNLDRDLGSDDLFACAARALSPDRRCLFYDCGEYVLDAAFGRLPGHPSFMEEHQLFNRPLDRLAAESFAADGR